MDVRVIHDSPFSLWVLLGWFVFEALISLLSNLLLIGIGILFQSHYMVDSFHDQIIAILFTGKLKSSFDVLGYIS